jgi:hypothetical protein
VLLLVPRPVAALGCPPIGCTVPPLCLFAYLLSCLPLSLRFCLPMPICYLSCLPLCISAPTLPISLTLWLFALLYVPFASLPTSCSSARLLSCMPLCLSASLSAPLHICPLVLAYLPLCVSAPMCAPLYILYPLCLSLCLSAPCLPLAYFPPCLPLCLSSFCSVCSLTICLPGTGSADRGKAPYFLPAKRRFILPSQTSPR